MGMEKKSTLDEILDSNIEAAEIPPDPDDVWVDFIREAESRFRAKSPPRSVIGVKVQVCGIQEEWGFAWDPDGTPNKFQTPGSGCLKVCEPRRSFARETVEAGEDTKAVDILDPLVRFALVLAIPTLWDRACARKSAEDRARAGMDRAMAGALTKMGDSK